MMTSKNTDPVDITPKRRVQKTNNNSTSQQPNRNRNRQQRTPEVEGFISLGKNPRSKIYAKRKLLINNRIVYNNLKEFNMIGFNCAMITGALLRFKVHDSIKHFEAYFERLIDNVCVSITKELKETQDYLDIYQKEGYTFMVENTPSECEISLLNSSSNHLVNLISLTDQLITNINCLEKCAHYNSSDKIQFERQWANLSREVNSRMLKLVSAIETKFELKLRGRSEPKALDKNKVQDLFNQFKQKQSQIDVIKFKPIPVKNEMFEFPQIAGASA